MLEPWTKCGTKPGVGPLILSELCGGVTTYLLQMGTLISREGERYCGTQPCVRQGRAKVQTWTFSEPRVLKEGSGGNRELGRSRGRSSGRESETKRDTGESCALRMYRCATLSRPKRRHRKRTGMLGGRVVRELKEDRNLNGRGLQREGDIVSKKHQTGLQGRHMCVWIPAEEHRIETLCVKRGRHVRTKKE